MHVNDDEVIENLKRFAKRLSYIVKLFSFENEVKLFKMAGEFERDITLIQGYLENFFKKQALEMKTIDKSKTLFIYGHQNYPDYPQPLGLAVIDIPVDSAVIKLQGDDADIFLKYIPSREDKQNLTLDSKRNILLTTYLSLSEFYQFINSSQDIPVLQALHYMTSNWKSLGVSTLYLEEIL